FFWYFHSFDICNWFAHEGSPRFLFIVCTYSFLNLTIGFFLLMHFSFVAFSILHTIYLKRSASSYINFFLKLFFICFFDSSFFHSSHYLFTTVCFLEKRFFS